MDKKRTPEDVVQSNAEVVADRAGRPGLDYRMQSYVVAKDTPNRRVLLGGLGCMGVGQMWFPDTEFWNNPNRPGYDEAPEQDSTGGLGTRSISELAKETLEFLENAAKNAANKV